MKQVLVVLIFMYLIIVATANAQNEGTASLTTAQTPLVGKEMSITVLAHPYVANYTAGSARFNNYEFIVLYDANDLKFVAIENTIAGLVVDKTVSTGGYLLLSASQPFGSYFYNQPTTLAQITFLPTRAGRTQLTLESVTIINSYGANGTSADVLTSFLPLSLTIGQSSSCSPSCDGKECGSNGCGGSCGICTNGQCQNNLCVCIPSCLGRECGADGCGGSCGICREGECRETNTSAACILSPDGVPEDDQETEATLQKPQSNSIFIFTGLVLIIIGLIAVWYFVMRKHQTMPPQE